MACPKCQCRHTPALRTETREYQFRGKRRSVIRRYRQCRNCGAEFWVQEHAEDDLLDTLNLPPEQRPQNPFL